MQTRVLQANPEADVKLYAVFYEVVQGDEGARRSVEPRDLLDDSRVTHFWDEDKLAGRWFDENVTRLGSREGKEDRIEWDAYFLYGADATWQEKPPQLVSWGRTVMRERHRLLRDFEKTLEN